MTLKINFQFSNEFLEFGAWNFIGAWNLKIGAFKIPPDLSSDIELPPEGVLF